MNQLFESVMGHGTVTCQATQNRDVDQQASALIYQHWGQRYDQLSAGAFHGALHEIRLPSFTVIRETSNRVILQKGCTPRGVFAIGTLLSSGDRGYHCGEVMGPRSAALLEPGTEFEIRTPEQFDLVAAVFSPRDLCANLDDPAIDPVELERDLQACSKTIDPKYTRTLADFLVRAYESGTQTPEQLMMPSSLRQLEEEFYALLTDTVQTPHRAHDRAFCPNRERVLRRFRHYLEAHPEASLNIGEICQEVGVTRRTLQNAVQEAFGISPQQYLKAIRLNAFRRALKTRHPQFESIGDVAARWGFWHLSQLARDYRRMFGELPSQTPCLHLS